MALLTLGSEVFEVSFTVMDSVGGGYDILLGLDMLRKHQACIDLKENCLRIGGSYVPFLAEKDIPKAMHEQEDEQVSPTGAASAPVPNTPGAQEAVSTVPPTSNPAPNGTTTEASPVASAATSNPISETVLKGLTDLGFSRNDASEALRLYNGDAEQAAAMLVSRKYGL